MLAVYTDARLYQVREVPVTGAFRERLYKAFIDNQALIIAHLDDISAEIINDAVGELEPGDWKEADEYMGRLLLEHFKNLHDNESKETKV